MAAATKTDTWLSTEEAAQLMGLVAGTLANWRAADREGQPKYHKSGSRVRYRRSVIEAWIESNAHGE